MTEIEVLKDLLNYQGILKAKVRINVSANSEVALGAITEAIEVIGQYKAIGTIEEFKVLKEKSVAKKVKGKHMSDSLEERQLCGEYTLYGYCPNCGEHITNLWNNVNCGDCGQKLDWGNEYDRE